MFKKFVILFFLTFPIFFAGLANLVEAQSIYTIKGALADSSAGTNQKKLVRTSNGDFHTVYHRSDGSKQQIYYAQSTDNGETWTETQLTTGDYDQQRPSIVVDSHDNLYVVWWGKHADSATYNQIRYLKYDGSWSSVTDLTSGDYEQNQSSIVIDSNDHLHIVWSGKSVDSPDYLQIRYLKYTDSWSSISNLTNDSYDQNRPFIGIDSQDNLHVVWWGKHADSAVYEQIRYLKYTDSWSSVIDLTSGDYNQNYPVFAIDSQDNIHVVFRGKVPALPTYDQIRYLKYDGSWSSVINLTNDSISTGNQNWNPNIAIDSYDNLHVFWNNRFVGNSNYDIFYLKYDGSWSEQQNLTSTVGVMDQHPIPIWFRSPIIDNAKIGWPKEGFAFIWSAGVDLKIYVNSDLAWDTPTFTVGGTVSGLSGILVLQNSGGDNLSLNSNGDFNFSTPLISGSTYDITVLTQPSGQTCSVSNGSGEVVSSSIIGISISCQDNPRSRSGSRTLTPAQVTQIFSNPPPAITPDTLVLPTPIHSSVLTSDQLTTLRELIARNVSRQTFIQPLYLGQTNPNAKALQTFLNTHGFPVSTTGPGSPGQETDYFGPLTQQALGQFQLQNKLISSPQDPAFGYLGPKTRALINGLQ